MIISKEQAKDIIYNQRGKIFGATFIKKDGSIRDMNCRTGVAKYLKGGHKLYNYGNLICVFDLKNKGYRTINIDTLRSLRIKGDTFYVE
ncbi:hypothetical protein CMI37_15035 [Candidatus Pacearchaeota archaeon]|nr:hypothetical protein [Candidatus Pacearchaeota archaeon]